MGRKRAGVLPYTYHEQSGVDRGVGLDMCRCAPNGYVFAGDRQTDRNGGKKCCWHVKKTKPRPQPLASRPENKIYLRMDELLMEKNEGWKSGRIELTVERWQEIEKNICGRCARCSAWSVCCLLIAQYAHTPYYDFSVMSLKSVAHFSPTSLDTPKIFYTTNFSLPKHHSSLQMSCQPSQSHSSPIKHVEAIRSVLMAGLKKVCLAPRSCAEEMEGKTTH